MEVSVDGSMGCRDLWLREDGAWESHGGGDETMRLKTELERVILKKAKPGISISVNVEWNLKWMKCLQRRLR